MARLSTADRVGQFLESDETDTELAREYLRLLLEEWRANAKAIQRHLALMATLVIAFTILAHSTVEELSLFGIKLTNYGVIIATIPVVIAGSLLRAVMRDTDDMTYNVIFYELTRQAYPGLYSSDLDEVITPTPLPFSHYGRAVLNNSTLAKVHDMAKVVEEMLFAFLIPLGFSTYAYIQLFANPRGPVAIVWLSLVVTVCLLVLAGVIAYLNRIEYNRLRLRSPDPTRVPQARESSD